MDIVTIGGGEIADYETYRIDEFIKSLTKKHRPNALFIPTASGDAPGYCQNFSRLYGEQLGCEVDFVLAAAADFDIRRAQKSIADADLIYVGGGNTQKMLSRWQETGISEALINAGENGTILSGISAGAICWHAAGLSDSEKFSGDTNWKLTVVKAMNLLPGMFCPHLNAELRHGALIDSVIETQVPAIACDNGAGVHWDGERAVAVTSLAGAYVYVFHPSGPHTTIHRFADMDQVPLHLLHHDGLAQSESTDAQR
ncbi:peptidase E [Marinobacter sp. TBZ242]|uniref:Peptidase E n=1 Tax=Marinobacter azerbaijanicus TaxID=3050455 RepID=A0ABT7ICT5_9GAMM|nr:peptidase E [Marinobacter sp. TBZ242]MDL0431473.1 peptidase E [Marinobacter sp. TBZ242]